MEQMNIALAQYVDNPFVAGSPDSITATIDGITMSVPLDEANRHYAEIMRQVEAGELVIEFADTPE